MNNVYQIGPIKMIGDFSYYDRHNALASIFLVGRTLKSYLDLDEMSLFKLVFPEIVVTASYTLQCDAFVYPDKRVVAYPGRLSSLVVVHEWGHLFELWLPEEVRPSTLLFKDGIKDLDGNLLTGPLGGGLYNRDCGLKAPNDGRLSDDWRVGYQIHPRDWMNGNTPTEDWADLWLAFILDWFSNDVAGQTRKSWISSHMVDWLKFRIG